VDQYYQRAVHLLLSSPLASSMIFCIALHGGTVKIAAAIINGVFQREAS